MLRRHAALNTINVFAKRCAQDLSVAELKKAILQRDEKVLNKLLYFADTIPATRQNLRYKTHQALAYTPWFILSSEYKAMCFAATTQTGAGSLGMLGEWFWRSWSPSMSIYLIIINITMLSLNLPEKTCVASKKWIFDSTNMNWGVTRFICVVCSYSRSAVIVTVDERKASLKNFLHSIINGNSLGKKIRINI